MTGAEFLDQYVRWLGQETKPAEREPDRTHFAYAKIRQLGYQPKFGFAETMKERERLAEELRYTM